MSGSHRDFDVWVVSSCQRSTTGLNYRNKLQICTMATRYNISLFGKFEKFVEVCESGLKFLSGDRALLWCSPAIPCQFPRQMAIDGPEWGKCLVNKASRRYSGGFRELNSLQDTPCSNFYLQSFGLLLIYFYLHMKSGLLLRLPARLCFLFFIFFYCAS